MKGGFLTGTDLCRRIACSTVLLLGLSASATAAQPAANAPSLGGNTEAGARCAGSRDLALRNGKIITMSKPAMVAELVIRDGKVVHLGPGGRGDYTRCTREIDLKGKTAIPGLIDGHIHLVTWGFRPGADVRLDLASSIADLTAAFEKRTVGLKAGEWITSVGGWRQGQFAQNRLPSLTELDQAAPQNPVFLWERQGAPAVTNSKGKLFFEAKGIAVAADGSIAAAGSQSALAYSHLAHVATDPVRGTADAMAYIASVGLTTISDAGVNAGPTGSRPPERSWHSGHVDLYTAYDPILAQARAGTLTARVRINFMAIPEDASHHKMQLRYQFPLFGNDMIATLCMGEYITLDPKLYEATALEVAQRGWCHEQHVLGAQENHTILEAWERIDAQASIKGLHWRLAHVSNIEQQDLDRLVRLGAGVNISPQVLEGGAGRSVAYRTILGSGVQVAAISDGPNYYPVDPWVHIGVMVTGKDSLGRQLVAPAQTLTREDALKLYTVNQGWFMGDERLGVLRPGSLGDVVVLDKDYLTTPDESIRSIKSVLTIVGGRPVFERRGR